MVLLAAAACAEADAPDAFVGLWAGSNSVFSQFQLNLQQASNTAVWGAALFIFDATATTVADTDFVATIAGQTLAFTMPVPPSTGYTTVDFRGERSGTRIAGQANGIPIVLLRH